MAILRSRKNTNNNENTSTYQKEFSTKTIKEINSLKKKRVISEEPKFTLKDIRNAIPEYCFHRSLFTSCMYLAADLLMISGLVYFALNITTLFPDNKLMQSLSWIIYWVITGHVGTGLWVIGHECGHHGFTGIEWLNDVFGFIIHSFLMVPYFSWQISHRKHHSNTGNIDRDEVHVPSVWKGEKLSRSEQKLIDDDEHHLEYFALLRYSFLKRIKNIFIMLVFGWPFYLLKNASGHQNYPRNRFVNHFLPSSPIYLPKEGPLIVASDLGVIAAIFALYKLGTIYTHLLIAKLYVMPYLITNLFLVMITYLQHTHIDVPHYDNKEWEWLRGALLTIDRSYGKIVDILFHHIADTHVAHHLFSYLPHYHAQEATKAIKKLIGDYYKYDDTNVWKALWQNHTMSHFIMSEESEVYHDDKKRKHVYWYYPHDAYLKAKVVKNI